MTADIRTIVSDNTVAFIRKALANFSVKIGKKEKTLIAKKIYEQLLLNSTFSTRMEGIINILEKSEFELSKGEIIKTVDNLTDWCYIQMELDNERVILDKII
jgi:hypothetical protein